MASTRLTKAQLQDEISRLKAWLIENEDRVANEQALRTAAEAAVASKDDELAVERANTAAAAQQAAAAIAAAANQAPAAPQPPANVIPKPHGSGGSTYNIRRAMGLGNNKARYSQCLQIVRDLTLKANVEWQKDFMHQDPTMMGHLFHAIEEAEPYMARFEASWATADMIKQFLRNWRKYRVRRGYVLPRPATRRHTTTVAATQAVAGPAGTAAGPAVTAVPAPAVAAIPTPAVTTVPAPAAGPTATATAGPSIAGSSAMASDSAPVN